MRTKTLLKHLLLPALLILTLAGCQQGPDRAALEQYASTAMPADTELADIYQRSCQACHSRGSTGAPLTGDEAAWEPRLEQGMDTLLSHVVDGFGGMPPYGLCMDCSASEFEHLIAFMSHYPEAP
ncbi:c-type cytochrome [Marinobacter zhejiangensis]|uniref:c-type cytochrome n=1 Tax=Marinobacter zhejiangensis TaxID=488535 RepID=UPI001FE0DB53|nr:c-type cytochrome [Marinobacter zhejiangensis]